MNDELAIHVKGLYKNFGANEVLKNCSMSVEQGTIYGFIGANGEGKTTLFKILTGLLKPTMGEAYVLGLKASMDNYKILKKIGSIIETPIFYEHLSAMENLEIHLSYMGIDAANLENTLKKVGLTQLGNQPVSEFSLGMRQRLAIARAIIHKPRLLILDEPVNGLDPVGIKEMRQLFLDLVREEGMTILFSSHILTEVEQIASKIGVIADGTIVREEERKDINRCYTNGLEGYFMETVNRGGKHE